MAPYLRDIHDFIAERELYRALKRCKELIQYEQSLAAVPAGREPSRALLDVRWMVEELRVSLFAPPMRTAHPVSEQRIARALATA